MRILMAKSTIIDGRSALAGSVVSTSPEVAALVVAAGQATLVDLDGRTPMVDTAAPAHRKAIARVDAALVRMRDAFRGDVEAAPIPTELAVACPARVADVLCLVEELQALLGGYREQLEDTIRTAKGGDRAR